MHREETSPTGVDVRKGHPYNGVSRGVPLNFPFFSLAACGGKRKERKKVEIEVYGKLSHRNNCG
jgi:hypothetical protein